MLANRARLVGALSAAGIAASGLILVTPASASSTPGYACVVDTLPQGANPQVQPIQVCASFDKSNYASGDVVKATVSVKNLGTAPAPGVTILPSAITGSDQLISNPVGPLMTNGIGPDLAPGDTIVSEVDGYAADPASGAVTFTAPVYQFVNDTGQPFGDPVSITSSVMRTTGNYSGVVFADGNGNHSVDPGEGMAGVQVTLSGPFKGINGNGPQNYTATTDANGAFTLTGLPTGQYSASVTPPSGWYVHPANGGTVTVTNTDSSPDLYEATPSPVPLKASMTFDKTSYHAGDTANVTLTLTNTSANPLYGVEKECDPPAENGELLGVGSGWDQFDAPGITVPADQTLTFHLSEIIPVDEAGEITGKYTAVCLFSPFAGYEIDPAAQASVEATLLAPDIPTTNFVLNVVEDESGAGMLSLHLVDPTTGDIVAGGLLGSGTSNPETVAQGTWNIAIAPGSYGTDNWQFAPGQSTTIDTTKLTPGQTVDVHVVPKTPLAPPTPPAAFVLPHPGIRR